MTTQVTTACFKISGEYLVGLCRDIVLEPNYNKALRILGESLPDMSLDQCREVLKGDATLKGVNALEYVEEEDPEYKAKVAAMFEHIVRYGDEYYTPYAIVTGFDAGDISGRHSMYGDMKAFNPPTQGVGFKEKHINRGAAYCADPGDAVWYAPKNGPGLWPDGVCILLQRVGEPPYWLFCSYELSDMDKRLLAMDRRGLRRIDPNSPQHPGELRVSKQQEGLGLVPESKSQSATLAELVPDVMAQFGADPERTEAVMSALIDEPETGPPEVDREMKHDSGYIDRRGRFYGCLYMHHKTMAPRIIEHVLGKAEEYAEKDPQAMLDEEGFVRIAYSMLTEDINIMFESNTLRPTPAQKRKVADFCIKHELRQPHWMKDS